MNDRFKFRFWDKDCEKYVSNERQRLNGLSLYMNNPQSFVTEQCTGLKDKNGKKVYEGDIVKTKYGRLCRVVRVFLPSYVGWDLEVFDENNALTTKKPDEYDLYYKDNLEVIGTIFDKESDNGREESN